VEGTVVSLCPCRRDEWVGERRARGIGEADEREGMMRMENEESYVPSLR
jgi:hypothetical protein